MTKNCSDWEQEIVGELESAELEEHLRGCERCREFAEEIEKNRAALAEISIDAAAFTAVRQRVLSEIGANKRRARWWVWSAVTAAILTALYITPRLQDIAPPAPIIVAKAPREIEWTPKQVHHHTSGRYLAKARPAQKTEPIVAVKMLTDDPNVIIIWLVDQKGDSL